MKTTTNETRTDWRDEASMIARALEWHANRLGVEMDYSTRRAMSRSLYWAHRSTAKTFVRIDAAMASRIALAAVQGVEA